jgi:predicted ArsR family transcriptional regulator
MKNRKEFDDAIKNALVEKYGYGEFKADWEEIAEVVDLNLQQAKYHIFKLQEQGFLRVISRAQRSGGYTSPNVIHILNPQTEENTEDIFRDVADRMQYLMAEAKRVAAYRDRIKELENEVRLVRADRDSIFNENVRLREQLGDLRHKLLGQ